MTVSLDQAPSHFLPHHYEKQLDPQLLTSFENQSLLCKIKGIGIAAGSILIITLSFILSSIYAPIFIPIVGITSILLFHQIKKIYKSCMNDSYFLNERSEQLRQTNQHYQNLSSFNPVMLQYLLHQKGIYHVMGMQNHDSQLTSLKPIIARYLYWEARTARLEKEKEEIVAQAQTLEIENSPSSSIKSLSLRTQTLKIEQLVLESKIKNAFIHAILHRPHLNIDFGSFGTFSSRNSHAFFLFNNTYVPALSYNDVLTLTVSELSMRMLAVMPLTNKGC